MSNSPLISYTKISPNRTSPRKKPIRKITIHHMAGNLTVEQCGAVFAPTSRKASSNYGIGTDGRIGMYVEEKDRAWTSSSPDNDNQAVTIEVANNTLGPNWTVSDKAMASLIDLCVDICKRNGIQSRHYVIDPVSGEPAMNNAQLSAAAIRGLEAPGFDLGELDCLVASTSSPSVCVT